MISMSMKHGVARRAAAKIVAALVMLGAWGLALGAAFAAQPPLEGEMRRNSKDGAEMVWVPAGEFTMGMSDALIAVIVAERPEFKAEWYTDSKPQHAVTLRGFWVYKYEVTVKQYRAFCRETKRKMPELPKWADDQFPMVNVTWYDARAYCEWAGGRLPTEAEWEKAARGTDSRRFPWGNTWNQEFCNNFSDKNPAGGGTKGIQAAPIGSYPRGASPYGVEDMAGNVWEWCQDWYDEGYYAKSPAENPTGPKDGELKVLRGGSWGSSSRSIGTATRNAEQPELTYHDDGGFRCVVPAK